MTIGEKLRTARLEARLTQEQLAGNDLTTSYISEIERGRRTPRLITLKVLARRLNRPLSYFYDGASEDREAEVHLQLGLARLHLGQAVSAIRPLEKALELAVQQGVEHLQARVELSLAAVDLALRSFQQAQRRLERCLRVFAHNGDLNSLAAGRCCLGFVKLGSGDPTAAAWEFQAGLQLAEKTEEDPPLRSRLQLGMGIAQWSLGHVQAARAAFGRALETAGALADHHRLASWQLCVADAAAGDGRFERAFEHARSATAICEMLAHKRTLAEIHERLGELEAAENGWEAAERHYRWSATLHGAAEDVPGMGHALSSLAEVLLRRTSAESARSVCECALGLLDGDAGHEERGRVLRVMGTIYRVAGRREDAKAALEGSLAAFGAPGRSRDVRLAHQELALLALEGGDVEEARTHLETLQTL